MAGEGREDEWGVGVTSRPEEQEEEEKEKATAAGGGVEEGVWRL